MDVYVGNLSYKVTEEDLKLIFSEYGEVTSVKLPKDKDTKKSKGYAFVSMRNNEKAQLAIEELNGAEYEGRTIVVREATRKG